MQLTAVAVEQRAARAARPVGGQLAAEGNGRLACKQGYSYECVNSLNVLMNFGQVLFGIQRNHAQVTDFMCYNNVGLLT